MLRFIVGRASSGKTFQTVKMASEAVKRGEKVIILVPEQFSFECEKKVLSALGDSLAQNIGVLSFSRICDEVDRATGGVCSAPLRDSDIHIIMKKAIAACFGELSAFKKFAKSEGFASKMAQTVYELKINCVSPDELRLAAKSAEDNNLAAKLKDTALVFETYNALITEKYVDPSDKLNILYNKLEGYPFFKDKTVFIDSFDGFTGQQFRITERILSQCKDLFITLNLDKGNSGEYGIFANTRKLKARLINSAQKLSVTIGEEIALSTSYYENKSLASVEGYLYNGTVSDNNLEGVAVCRADTVYDEAEFVARDIRKTVREQGARYRDFVIVARDIKPYIIPLKNAMAKNGVPFFTDSRTPLLQTAAASVFVAAAELLCGIKSERIFRFYKSGLDYFTAEELAILENYSFIWGIDDNLWLKEWDMNPKGLENKAADKEELARINELRKKAILPILKNIKGIEPSAKSIITALMGVINDCGAVKSLSGMYKGSKACGDTASAEVVRQSYDAIISVLDSIAAAYKNEEITPREFASTLSSAVSLETVGSIPASLDEVSFGAADRIRPARPEYVYIIGANQGVFPCVPSASGVFSNTDREKMIDLGVQIPDKTVLESINEEYLVYTNVCSAKRKLTMSYSALQSDGEPGTPSAFVSGLCSAFNIKVKKEPDALCADNAPETEKSAFSRFCRVYNTDKVSAAQLIYSLGDNGYKQRADELIKSAEKPHFKITRESAGKLFGKKLSLSPSSIENFSKCRFYYFCNNALKISALKKSDFNAAQRGMIIHYVLEKAVTEHGKELANFSDKETDRLTDEYIERYLGEVPGFSAVRSERIDYLIKTISRGAKVTLRQLAEELRNTDFVPVACELRINDIDGEIPALKIALKDGNFLEVTGVVDRLDRYEGYIRVIDYKTGTMEFRLSNLLVGQNIQMLLYLYAVCGSEKYGGSPAAVLYKIAKRNISGDYKKDRMNGLIAKDPAIQSAMDKSGCGKYMPTLKSTSCYVEPDAFNSIFNYLDKMLAFTGNKIYSGDIAAEPVSAHKTESCKYCEFGGICRIKQSDVPEAKAISNDETLELLERWEENNG